MAEAEFQISTDASNCVVETDPVVVSENHFTFTVGGRKVGSIKATFDFSDVPMELHQTAIQLVMQGRMSLAVPAQMVGPMIARLRDKK